MKIIDVKVILWLNIINNLMKKQIIMSEFQSTKNIFAEGYTPN